MKGTAESFKDESFSFNLFNTQERNMRIDLEMQDDADDLSLSSRYNSDDMEKAEEEKVDIATSETQQVMCLRATLFLASALVATFVSLAVYHSNKGSETIQFENYAMETCEKVTTSFQASASSRVSAVESLAKSISSNAAAQGLTWPNVTVPDFEERMALTLDLAQVMSITLLPLVTGENLDGWLDYSIANQGWFNESLQYGQASGTNYSQWQDDIDVMEATMGSIPDNSIPEAVYQFGSNTSANAHDGPFLPWWQFAPAFPISSLVNYDTLSNPSRKYQLQAVLKNREALVSEAWDYSDDENPATFGRKMVLNLFLGQWEEGGKRYQDGPVSDLYYPVFERSGSQGKEEDKEVAAILTAYVYWQVYFDNVLPPHSEPVVAVLENVCGDKDNHRRDSGRARHVNDQDNQRTEDRYSRGLQQVSSRQEKLVFDIIEDGELVAEEYQIRPKDEHSDEYLEEEAPGKHEQQFTYVIRGTTAEYIGPGDLHDPLFDYLGKATDMNAFLSGKGGRSSDLLEGQCMYRVRVYPTQEMKDNMSTNQPLRFMLIILATFGVTSLIFMVYDYFVEQRQKVVMTKAIKSTAVVHTLFPENVRSRLFEDSSNTNQGSSHVRRSSPGVTATTADNNASSQTFDADHLGRSNGPMVADLYKDCTVLFADLAGFTKFSSGREPKDIFLLLETLYGAFDRTAKRRGVFKVETIGDCYLAITGVPCPQKDHAVLMAKFACDCMEKMDYLIHTKLANQLGEEVRELKLRVGMHSGCVTAGVLRGERARFQLFGDTVNTASRMESLSLPGKIQVSSDTAALLREAMKGAWLQPREGGVEAKGKGRLATFWVQPKLSSRARFATSVSTSGYSGESDMYND